MASIDESKQFIPLNIAVLTVSDTRALADDKSGQTLADRLTAAGHHLAAREIVTDDVEAIRAVIRRWIADTGIDVVITTGGTGFTGRDVTPEAIEPLFEKRMDGFSIAFHMLSHAKIGTSTIQSPRHRRRRRRHLHLLPAGLARRLSRRLGRHPRRPARLPHASLQFRRDHAAPGRASAKGKGAGRDGVSALSSPLPSCPPKPWRRRMWERVARREAARRVRVSIRTECSETYPSPK
ncbi:molybdenum cofactor biosynthesis protein B [Bradyrhizobium japonicum]